MSSLDIPRDASTLRETDARLSIRKMLKAFEHGLTPIMCCGETLDAERAGRYHGLHPPAG